MTPNYLTKRFSIVILIVIVNILLSILMPISKGEGLPAQTWVNDSKWSKTTFLKPISRGGGGGGICKPKRRLINR